MNVAVESPVTTHPENPLLRLWQRLTEPAPELPEGESRRRARLLAALLVVIFVAGIPGTVIYVASNPNFNPLFSIIAFIIFGVAYVFSRTRHHLLGAVSTVMVLPVAMLGVTLMEYARSGILNGPLLAMLIVGVLLANLLLSVRWTLAVAFLSIGEVLAVPLLVPTAAFDSLVVVVVGLVVMSLLIMMASLVREADQRRIAQQVLALEQARSQQRTLIGQEQQAREHLETTVADYQGFVAAVAGGDLTRRLALADRQSAAVVEPLLNLGEHLNAMVDSLLEMAQQIGETGAHLAQASSEILATTSQQHSSTTEQEATVTQTAATVTQMQSAVAQTADLADRVAQTAARSVQVSQQGRDAVTRSIGGMQLIRDRVDTIAHTILALSEKSQRIGGIIETVDAIAEQSRLLALNASIEAARAGEEGRGFGVVANEVRGLAEQSRQATEQVRAILGEIQNATNTAVMATEEGSKGVDLGQQLIDRAGQTIEELSAVIEDAAGAGAQIAASIRQQAGGMSQLADAMQDIRQATAQTRTNAQQAERAARDLSTMAQQMQHAIARYRL